MAVDNPLAHPTLARRRFLAVAAASAAAALAAACGSTPSPSSPGTSPAPTSGSDTMTPTGPSTSDSGNRPTGVGRPVTLKSSVERRAGGDGAAAQRALADFGSEMLRRVHGEQPNTAVSPYSLFTVLAMARAGAQAGTGAQLDAALTVAGTDPQGAAITAVDAGVLAAVTKSQGPNSPPITVRTANQTWVQTGFDVREDYLDLLAQQFGVDAVAADFSADPDGMRSAINTWVSDRTNALIKELFGPGSIDDLTRLVLVNAVYLKANWQTPFTPAQHMTAFTTGTGKTTEIPLMHAGDPVPGLKGDGWMAATAGYVGRGLTMTILVPDAGRFDDVLDSFDAAVLAAASKTAGRYTFSMPGFAIRSAPDVMTAIKAMGVTDLFDPATVDLSGIAGVPGDLVASTFVHQAVVLVDENGTEAAAATGLGLSATGMPQIDGQIIVDRPFLFWISDVTSGAPLFLGAVTDPTA